MPAMAKKKSTADRHKKRLLPCRVDATTWAAIEALAFEERRTMAQMTAILLEDSLVTRGRIELPQRLPPSK